MAHFSSWPSRAVPRAAQLRGWPTSPRVHPRPSSATQNPCAAQAAGAHPLTLMCSAPRSQRHRRCSEAEPRTPCLLALRCAPRAPLRHDDEDERSSSNPRCCALFKPWPPSPPSFGAPQRRRHHAFSFPLPAMVATSFAEHLCHSSPPLLIRRAPDRATTPATPPPRPYFRSASAHH